MFSTRRSLFGEVKFTWLFPLYFTDKFFSFINLHMWPIYSINFCFSSSSSSSSSNFLRGSGSHLAPGMYGGSLTALRCSKFRSFSLLRFSALSRNLCSFLRLAISLTHWDSPAICPRTWLINCGFRLRVHSNRDELMCPWYFTPRLPKNKTQEGRS